MQATMAEGVNPNYLKTALQQARYVLLIATRHLLTLADQRPAAPIIWSGQGLIPEPPRHDQTSRTSDYPALSMATSRRYVSAGPMTLKGRTPLLSRLAPCRSSRQMLRSRARLFKTRNKSLTRLKRRAQRRPSAYPRVNCPSRSFAPVACDRAWRRMRYVLLNGSRLLRTGPNRVLAR